MTLLKSIIKVSLIFIALLFYFKSECLYNPDTKFDKIKF